MVAVLLIIISCGAVWLLMKSSISSNNATEQPNIVQQTPIKPKKPKQKEIIVQTLDFPDDYEDGTYESKIAGISLRCTEADKGIFNGVIYNEEDNPYNSNAMAIVSMKKKLIGYIPESELEDYYDWSNGLPVTCVGFIKSFVNEEGRKIVFGRVTAIKPCNSKFVASTTLEIEEDIRLNEFLSPSRV